VPTVGFATEEFQKHGVNFCAFDMSGQSKYRSLWEQYYSDVEAIIWVIDSTDKIRAAVVQDELKKTISDDHNPKYADGEGKVPDPHLWVSIARSRAIAADFKIKDIQRHILGESVDIEYASKAEPQLAEERHWANNIRWYQHLTAVGFTATWASADAVREMVKRAKLA